MTDFDIEDKINKLFCGENGKTPAKERDDFWFKAVEIGSVVTVLSRPGFSAAVVSGSYEKEDSTDKLKVTSKIIVYLVFKNVANEVERRRLLHPAVKYVVGKLQGNNLGLDIEPLNAKNWKETTTPEHLIDKILEAEIEFETAYTLTPETEEASYRNLLSIWSSFKSEEEPHEELATSKVNFDNGETP